MIEVPLAQPARVTPDRTLPVRPRPAASLILLRASAEGIAVLMGRRVRSARFMPGFYVCPGGRVAGEDSDTWLDELRELGVHHVEFRCDPLARAALRETYEETGVLVGRPGRAVRQATAPTPVEAAYRAADIVPDLALLTYIGRAITPTSSPMRFNTSFFLADGRHAVGAPADSAELEDVAWRPADPGAERSMSGVTRFMLARALAVWAGDTSPPPLYRHIGNRAYVTPRHNRGGLADKQRITR